MARRISVGNTTLFIVKESTLKIYWPAFSSEENLVSDFILIINNLNESKGALFRFESRIWHLCVLQITVNEVFRQKNAFPNSSEPTNCKVNQFRQESLLVIRTSTTIHNGSNSHDSVPLWKEPADDMRKCTLLQGRDSLAVAPVKEPAKSWRNAAQQNHYCRNVIDGSCDSRSHGVWIHVERARR